MSSTLENASLAKDRLIANTEQAAPTTGRALIPEALFNRLVARIAGEEALESSLAERIMDQALVFLAASAHHTGGPLSPSELVDVGWHTFILYTREYAEFCNRVAGRFIHHVPDDAPGAPAPAKPSVVRDRTLTAIAAAGYVIDPGLWTLNALKCGSCHEKGNCRASGPTGDENTETRTPE
jgi:hypothetical protein